MFGNKPVHLRPSGFAANPKSHKKVSVLILARLQKLAALGGFAAPAMPNFAVIAADIT